MDATTNIIEKLRANILAVEPAIDQISKYALAITGISYVLGLVIVNLSLSDYGFFSLSLFRLQYVLAGFWFVLTISISIVLWSLVVTTIRIIVRKASGSLERTLAIVALVVAPILIPELTAMARRTIGIQGGWDWLGFSAGIFFLYTIARVQFSREELTKVPRAGFLFLALVYMFILFLIVASIGTFSKSYFRRIPGALGGGRPQKAQLLVSASAFNAFRSFEIPFNSSPDSLLPSPTNGLITDTLFILTTTDNELVLLLPTSMDCAISVAKDNIIAIRNIPDGATPK